MIIREAVYIPMLSSWFDLNTTEPTAYHTQGKHTNQYTTNVVQRKKGVSEGGLILRLRQRCDER